MGGALWYDCQAYNSERLLLSFLHSAVQAGAELANYVEVTGFIWEGGRIAGVKAQDILGGDHFQVRGKIVVNTSGPWINQVLSLLGRPHKTPPMRLAKVLVLLTRPIVGEYALGVWSGQRYLDEDAPINKGSRLFFITPWHKYNLVGTTEQPYEGSVDHCRPTEGEIQDLINQVNRAYPGAHLRREDVLFFYTGLLPR
ncbi:glycerol-3-phosphate dehydrogenase, partial [Candidatus Hakubella thermalkaliphila]